MRGIIDRFEGDIAVVEIEGRKMIHITRRLLPPEAQEGDVIAEESGAYHIDRVETERKKKEIDGLLDELWE